MNSIYQAHWIKAAKNTNPCVPEFFRDFSLQGQVQRAELNITALGVFYAQLNGKKIGDDIFAPGWTSYTHRLQYMTYDVTGLLQQNNHLSVCVGRGWRFHKLKAWGNKQIAPDGAALLCALTVTYTDGTEETILSDENWFVRRTATVYNDMYNGETYDATKRPGKASPAVCFSYSKKILLPLEGVPVKEHEIFDNPQKIITPKGETVLDFGQELTGYVQIHVHGQKGDRLTVNDEISISELKLGLDINDFARTVGEIPYEIAIDLSLNVGDVFVKSVEAVLDPDFSIDPQSIDIGELPEFISGDNVNIPVISMPCPVISPTVVSNCLKCSNVVTPGCNAPTSTASVAFARKKTRPPICEGRRWHTPSASGKRDSKTSLKIPSSKRQATNAFTCDSASVASPSDMPRAARRTANAPSEPGCDTRSEASHPHNVKVKTPHRATNILSNFIINCFFSFLFIQIRIVCTVQIRR